MLEESIDHENDIPFAGTIVSEFQVTEPMIKTFSLGRMVKILAFIDLIFAFVFAIGNAFFFIPIFMPIVGYVGAVYYNKNYTLTYFIYVFGITLFRAAYFIYLYTNLSSEEQNNQVQTIMVVFLTTFIELWISKIIYRFYSSMKGLSLLDLTNLRLSTNLTNPRLILW